MTREYYGTGLVLRCPQNVSPEAIRAQWDRGHAFRCPTAKRNVSRHDTFPVGTQTLMFIYRDKVRDCDVTLLVIDLTREPGIKFAGTARVTDLSIAMVG